MSEQWRMAFMLDARDGDLARLEQGLKRAGPDIRRLAGEAHVRLGVVDQQPEHDTRKNPAHDSSGWRSTDGAVEITVDAARAGELAALAKSLREVIDPLAAPGSVQVMAGPMFPQVPTSEGEVFLSLAFRRYPGTTSEEFSNWWRFTHSPLCIPIVGKDMLAYDQVHVDAKATETIAAAYGAELYPYDAYDNLTYTNRNAFLTSTTSDPDGMMRILKDEEGRIDNTTRRHALMRRVA